MMLQHSRDIQALCTRDMGYMQCVQKAVVFAMSVSTSLICSPFGFRKIL